MKVTFTNAISPYYNQKQIKVRNNNQTTFTSKTDVFKDTLSIKNSSILEDVINNAFENCDATGIMTTLKQSGILQPLFRTKTPYFYRHSSYFPLKCSIDCIGLNGEGLSISGDAGKKNISLINNFLSKKSLYVDSATINKYQGPEAAEIIAGKWRDSDPGMQPDWEYVLGAVWPPSTKLAGMKVVPEIDNSGHAIILNTSAKAIEAYGTIPRSMVILPDNNSIVNVSQQVVYKSPRTISQLENVNNTWRAWAIHPLALKPNKKTLIAIPLQEGEAENYLSNEMRESGQWSINETRKFALLDASKASPKSECIKGANCCIVATEGDNHFYLFRSHLPADSNNAVSKFYSASEKQGGQKYGEIEFFGNPAEPDKTSTLIHRIDQIDRKRLELPSINANNIEDITLNAAEQILSKMKN